MQQNLKKILTAIRAQDPLLKFAYLGEGAHNFIRVLRSPEYHTTRNELEIINRNREKITSCIKDRIVVLGVGDGRKIQPLVHSESEVVLVDISEELLATASSVLDCGKRIICSDFQSLDFGQFGQVTFLMLGGTLGNFSSWTGFLEKLGRESPGSNLILGMEFFEGSDQLALEHLINEYSNEDGFNFVFRPLTLLGFERRDGTIKVEFNHVSSRIEERFHPNEAGLRKCAALGLDGSAILLSASLKMGVKEFERALADGGISKGLLDEAIGQNRIMEVMP